jgi:hypothetical protein
MFEAWVQNFEDSFFLRMTANGTHVGLYQSNQKASPAKAFLKTNAWSALLFSNFAVDILFR